MKMNKVCTFPLLVFLVVLIVCNPNAYAEQAGAIGTSGGGTTAVSVADTVHSAAKMASLSEEFNRAMSEYESEDSEDIKEGLLKRAKNILAQLIEQANNVESEISIISKKKLGKLYSKKLDRVLSIVLQMRKVAESKMQAAEQPS